MNRVVIRNAFHESGRVRLSEMLDSAGNQEDTVDIQSTGAREARSRAFALMKRLTAPDAPIVVVDWREPGYNASTVEEEAAAAGLSVRRRDSRRIAAKRGNECFLFIFNATTAAYADLLGLLAGEAEESRTEAGSVHLLVRALGLLKRDLLGLNAQAGPPTIPSLFTVSPPSREAAAEHAFIGALLNGTGLGELLNLGQVGVEKPVSRFAFHLERLNEAVVRWCAERDARLGPGRRFSENDLQELTEWLDRHYNADIWGAVKNADRAAYGDGNIRISFGGRPGLPSMVILVWRPGVPGVPHDHILKPNRPDESEAAYHVVSEEEDRPGCRAFS
jgi:hypothetical protein